MKSFICILLSVFLCAIQALSYAQTTLNAYIDSALHNNPEFRASKYHNEALQKEIRPAKSLDDPMLYAGIMNLPVDFSLTQDMMTMKQIGLQENFSVGKKYALRGEVAQKDYEANGLQVDIQKLILIKQVKQQYYDLYAQSKAVDITLKSIILLKSYIDIANARYSAGEGTQQDVLKAELELSTMQEDLIKLQSMKADMAAMFNSLLYRDKMDSVALPAEIPFRKIDINMDTLMQYVRGSSPTVIASKAMLSRDSSAYMLEKTSKIPDFNAGLWYGERQAITPEGAKAPDMFGFTFGITLPVFASQKQNPRIAASTLNLEESQYQVKASQNNAELMLHHALIDAMKNEQLIAFYNGQLIPQAKANLEAGVTGYQQNKIDFMTLTDNFLSLYNYQLEYYQAMADYYKAVANIEMITGKTLIQ